ncbi:polyprenol phosphomannose-dependent alpha 1,6 mannosyltransferase MptB [Arthrobacter sp. B2a2-09]|uniref:polyprenol phosphomannose-dependent alpha 1,6 mannosyltransferase MptB n=1 Tax=Arthrobacter sp. B2a2-09 TaxID=2952822 RepID=UPI0022CDAAA8|nr:polyprenol phosphomannose-dependent alpha 1,6 mannosyltransferase MptB [Arthrobacter sp. B2a2-09]MCZ9883727.1 polyprenol phosphomannose-dependent alpha 1,6 mannosyltransferase MptB [Arthrobacter sp. B2a2-09]
MVTSKFREREVGSSLAHPEALGDSNAPVHGTVIAKAARTAILQGFIGSLLMVAGSVGVGWMATTSGALIRTPIFIMARTSPVGVIVCTVMLCLGALLLLRSWLRIAQRIGGWNPSSRPVLRRALWMWAVPMMFSLPLFSRDAYAYIGQGRLMEQGLNPYTNGISALSNYFSLGPDKLWTEAPTPYGPLWLWIEQGAVWVSAGVPELALIPFRLAALAGVVLLAVYVPRLAALHGVNPERALWLGVLNPVLLINFIASAHNDSLMLGLVVAGLYFASVKRPVLGIVLITASIAIKPITLIALPFAGLLWAGTRAGWGRRMICWAATLGLSLGLLAAAGLVNGLGFGWLGALQTPGAVWIWYAPVGLLAHTAGLVVGLFGGPGVPVTDIIQTAGTAVSALAIVWLAVRTPGRGFGMPAPLDDEPEFNKTVLRRMAWAFAAVVVLAPVIQPWYMVWLLVFFTVTGIADGPQLRTVFYLTAFFTLIALTDQLSVFQWIPIDVVRGVAIAIAVSFIAYLVFFDKKTHVLFRPHRGILKLKLKPKS